MVQNPNSPFLFFKIFLQSPFGQSTLPYPKKNPTPPFHFSFQKVLILGFWVVLNSLFLCVFAFLEIFLGLFVKMELSSLRSDVAVLGRMVVGSVLEAVIAETLLAAQRSVASLLIVAGIMLKDAEVLPELIGTDKRFPFEELHKMGKTEPENKDGSDTEDDDEDDDGDADQDDDDDADDEDFSGEGGEEEDDDDEGDPEDNPAANGNEGSEDEDDDDDEDDEDDEEEEEDDEEEEEEEDQPPAKKKK